jgi:hypothetical protein
MIKELTLKVVMEIAECGDGFLVAEGTICTFFKTRQELADYIDPRPKPTEYDLAYKTHLQEVASKAKAGLVDHLHQNQFNCTPVKPEIQASDFLKAEAAKATQQVLNNSNLTKLKNI